MYRKLYKQVFNTNPTLFVMLSITCEAQYWNRHLSVTNYCNILLCSHIHVRVYICTLLAVSITTGTKDRTRETNKSCLKWRHLRTVRSQALIFCCIFNLIFGGFVVAIFLILMKKMICSLAASSDNFVIQILISLIIVIFVINLGVFTTDISASHLLV